MDDVEFRYFGEESEENVEHNEEEDEDLNEDYERRTVRVNADGKRMRGKDLSWTKKFVFNNMRAFEQSNFLVELKETHTSKRKREYEYAEVHNFVCKYFQKKGFISCQQETRIIFPSDSFEVIIQEANRHEHIRDADYIDKSVGHRWSRQATDIIVTGIKNGAVPKVIQRNLREANVFTDSVEPSIFQLNNKIAYLKRSLKLNEHIHNTHEMRQKIVNHIKVPDIDAEGYIPHYVIHDDVENAEDTRFTVIFSTKRLLSNLSKSDTLHLDATYRLNWQGYPVMIVGVSSKTGRFFGNMSVLSSHEDSEAIAEIYKFIHGLGVHPRQTCKPCLMMFECRENTQILSLL